MEESMNPGQQRIIEAARQKLIEEDLGSKMPPPSPASAQSGPISIAGFGKLTRRRHRTPMSLPTQRLEVQEIPGFRLYWFKEENVPRAYQEAWWDFVTNEEVALNRISIAGHPGVSGNTDLGSGVTIIGGTTEHGHPQRLVLMKLNLEMFKEDQQHLMHKYVERISSVFEGEKIFGEDGEINDSGQLTYTRDVTFRSRGSFVPLMNRPVRKARTSTRGRI